MKGVLNEVTVNPELAIEVAKYLHLFTNIMRDDPSVGSQVKRCFLQELEISYNGEFLICYNYISFLKIFN